MVIASAAASAGSAIAAQGRVTTPQLTTAEAAAHANAPGAKSDADAELDWRRHATGVQDELIHACTENDFDVARQIIVTTLRERGPERLNSMLQAEDTYGQSPLRLAANASGRSDTGDQAVKLLLLTCLNEIGATEDLFR